MSGLPERRRIFYFSFFFSRSWEEKGLFRREAEKIIDFKLPFTGGIGGSEGKYGGKKGIRGKKKYV